MARIVVVTGGTRGIGRATCEAFTAQGDQVIALGRSVVSAAAAQRSSVGDAVSTPNASPTPSGSPESTLSPAPWDLEALVCDVTSPESVRAAFAQIRDRYGRIDVLVNNAGLAGGDSIDAPDEAFFEAIVQSNLMGTWRCAAAAVPMMSRGARILCVSSVLGLKAVPDQIAYTAAKHGVIGLMKSLALALASRGITVNAVCPGWVDTDMARSRFAELGITPEQAAQGVPTGVVLKPAEVAALIVHLASPACSQLTGQAVALDGGVSAG